MRTAARVDGSHNAIVTALRSVGASVQPLTAVGRGCPDLLVGYRRATYLLEVKRDDGPPSKARLRRTQEAWIAGWRGAAPIVVHNAAEALAAVGATEAAG